MVAHTEHAPSLATATNELRPDTVELPGAMRWVERRVRLVHHVLRSVIGSPRATISWWTSISRNSSTVSIRTA